MVNQVKTCEIAEVKREMGLTRGRIKLPAKVVKQIVEDKGLILDFPYSTPERISRLRFAPG